MKEHFSLLAPLANNPDFPPPLQDPVFGDWHGRGLTQLLTLFNKDTFLSFETIKENNLTCQILIYLDIYR